MDIVESVCGFWSCQKVDLIILVSFYAMLFVSFAAGHLFDFQLGKT